MNNKERALDFIRKHPGLDALELAAQLGIRRPSSMEVFELEKEGKIELTTVDDHFGWKVC